MTALSAGRTAEWAPAKTRPARTRALDINWHRAAVFPLAVLAWVPVILVVKLVF